MESGSERNAGLDSEPRVKAGLESGSERNAGLDSEPRVKAGLESGSERNAGLDSEPRVKAGLESGSEINAGLDSAPRGKAGLESGENWIPEDVAQWLDHIGVSNEPEPDGGLSAYHSFPGVFALEDVVQCPPETVPFTINNDPTSMTTHPPLLSILLTRRTSTPAREPGDAALTFVSHPYVSAMRGEEDEGGKLLTSTMQEQTSYGGGEGGWGPQSDNLNPSQVASPPLLQQPPSGAPTSDSQLPPYPLTFPHRPLAHPQLRWARQEPQGQEQQADGSSLEKHGPPQPPLPLPTQSSLQPSLEELPSYEQAKAQTQGQHHYQDQLYYTLEDHESLPSPSHTPDSQPSAWTSLAPNSPSETSSPDTNTDPSPFPSPSPPLGPQQGFMSDGDEAEGLSIWGGGANGDSTLRQLKQGHVYSLSQRILQISVEANGTSNLPSSNPSLSYPPPLNITPLTGSVDSRGPPPEYPFKPTHPPFCSPSGKPQPPSSHSELGPPFIDPPSSTIMDWSTAQPTRAESNPPPEYRSRRHHPGTLGGPSVQYHHSPTPSQTHTSTLLPNIQAQTSTLVSQLQPQPQQPSPGPSGVEVVMAAKVQQMVQLLCEENQTLRHELLTHREKASKLHWLEEELQRISEEYDWLMKSSSKREGLDRTMRCKLEGEIRRLTVFNRDLRDRLETANQQLACCEPEGEEDGHAAELRDGLIEKERLEEEVEKQQRRAERLESALSSAQQRALHLEEELRVKCVYAARVEGLQHAVVQLQTACEKREQLERRLRTRLERELHTLRTQQRVCGGVLGTTGPGGGGGVGEGSAPALRELLRQREERVLTLEADSTRWEQKYLQENAMRHFNMETAATANTHRDPLVVHSHTSSYSEMTGCTLCQEDDVQQATRRCNDMEHRIRNLYAQLIEKDALIKVLQQRNARGDLSTLRPARSTPSISLATGLHPRQASQTDERKERNLLPSLPLLSSPPSSLSTTSSLPSTLPFSSTLPYSTTPSYSSTLPFSSNLPLSSSLQFSILPLSSSLPSTPLLSSHSKTGSRDSSTQTDKGSESLKVLPLPSRAWLGLVRTQRTDTTRTHPPHHPGTDLVEILI
uniref:angiomotin-like protein 1 isoform X1 n=2 Tax=Oncorhynchus gorbuscha TaxID=8017 RepID=UPI001EAF7908|nr:angiomotin-like protein 1 isoform X1 [Oncorhynchus gorbuscha]